MSKLINLTDRRISSYDNIENTQFLNSLKLVKTILDYDHMGLWMWYEDEKGVIYFSKWCDSDNLTWRNMAYRVNKELISKYKNKEITLNELILNKLDDFVYIRDDIDEGDCTSVQAYKIKKLNIPEEYLAKKDCYYDSKFEDM